MAPTKLPFFSTVDPTKRLHRATGIPNLTRRPISAADEQASLVANAQAGTATDEENMQIRLLAAKI